MRRQQILCFLRLLFEETRNIEKSIADTNARLKKFSMQKDIGLLNNNNVKKNFLGKRSYI